MKIIIFILIIMLSGCSQESVEITDNILGKQVEGVYKGNNIIESFNYYFKENVYHQYDIHAENSCIFDDYVIAFIGINDPANNRYSLEFGNDCYQRNADASIFIDNSIANDGIENYQVLDLVKIYYELPEDVEVNSYLDYVKYATYIEKIEE